MPVWHTDKMSMFQRLNPDYADFADEEIQFEGRAPVIPSESRWIPLKLP